jgi:ribonuclease Z
VDPNRSLDNPASMGERRDEIQSWRGGPRPFAEESNLRRALLPILIVVVGVGLIISLFRGPIAMRVMRAVLESNLAADPFDAFDDGLHVVLCGASGPLVDRDRSGPCLAIIAGRKLYMVDVGAGAYRSLSAQGLQPGLVEAVFLTHFHSDHISGLAELGVMRWVGGSWKTPLPVYGAEGLREITSGLNQAFRLDAVFRSAHHGSEVVPPTGAGLSAKTFPEPELGTSTIVFDRDGLRVAAFRVDHDPVKPAIGYRFDYEGRSVVVSGDTSKSANLERFAKGVDLLVHEALSPTLMGLVEEVATEQGVAGIAKVSRDVLNYHATPVEAAESAQTTGAKHLLYYHIVPPTPLPGLASVFLEGVADAYAGPVTLGRDGTMISLPSGSERVIVVSE